jgi:hypothetical protein
MCTANFFFEKGICEMKTEKERGGLAIFFLPNSAQTMLDFSARCLVEPYCTWASSQKPVPT